MNLLFEVIHVLCLKFEIRILISQIADDLLQLNPRCNLQLNLFADY